MFCNGACCFCSVPCSKSVIKENLKTEIVEKKEEVENIGVYEVKKNIFGKEVVRKVKNENRTLGIEHTP